MESSEQIKTSDLNSHFCIKLAVHIFLEEAEKGSNFVFSPVSLQILLRLIAIGSTGSTLDQILTCLGSKSTEDLNSLFSLVLDVTAGQNSYEKDLTTGPLVTMVNGSFIDQRFGLKSSYEGILRDVYKAEAKAVEFASKADQVIEEVNTWAEDVTSGLFKELLPPGSLGSDTALVFANALYFKGAWNQKFDLERSMHRDFYLLTGEIVQVPYMTTTKRERSIYREINGYKILKIPYQSGNDSGKFSMYFFLPLENNGLQHMVQNFNSTPGFFNQEFQLREENLGVRFWIPRFKFSFEFEASKTINELGLTLPFIAVKEFTELACSAHDEKLCVSKIFHKSFIDVNEEGTEAVASSGLARMSRRCRRVKPPGFIADHPFLFMIREETSRIVFFIGAVINPLLSTS
ncbi:hypothetical protein DCAR_0312498 [Daucus carota subsp. sativus]|uniref:Serpin domain-containing protein n=1 Tax=Daucus carota subsp. sativus TaxID=79200 RepID=A0A161XZK4_DAUCS|nr:PREDICTED: serpin-ZX-like [Daucus carota subsp. sativus]WOG93217.1 hypothetical protein DCAR_0312498 [Daucus carota subsp. sativus]